ncbi:MAG TPA: glycosyltransferase family 4 protein [Pseudonocardiaceae bacterium]|jgi:glycosyltransferase involved in cell wall biosynthesis|nr:glycosyltransferase family 4 protein [Pseudonocardiaceae bacterium]
MADPGLPVACTVVARNYLPAAMVLARSYLAYHPEHRFVIALLDGDAVPSPVEGCRIVGADWFDVDRTEYLRMAMSYTVVELAAAMKPLLLRQLLGEAPVVLFLEPDIKVFAPFGEVVKLAADNDIVLTPRFTEPLPRDDHEPAEASIMARGLFDLGFLAVSDGAKAFLDFWAERLRHDAIVAPESQVFADQRWADQIPALFRHTVVRDPAYNAAYWNLHERTLSEQADGTLAVNGEPLRFFHFAGYRPEQPWLLTVHAQHRPRLLLSESPTLLRLCESYRDELVAAGHRERDEAVPYGFDKLPDGTKVTVPMRRMFRHDWMQSERPDAEQLLFRRAVAEVPPHPFGDDGGAAYGEWMSAPNSPPERAAGLNRMIMLVWASRPDLQRAYPWPCGVDAAGFREWCVTYGEAEEVLPAWAMPGEPAPLAEPVDEFGVNVAGYLTAELGLGEMGRIVLRAVEHADVPVVTVVEEHSLSCRTALAAPDSVGRPRFPVSLMTVNSDQAELLLASFPEVGYRRYRIGLWAWELEELPPWQREGFAHVDEIWTVSEFCREAFQRHANVPVKVVPVPVADPGGPSRPAREPGRPVRFFFAFDYNSTGQRKNPWGLVTAFQRAFPGRDDVRLVIKATNSPLNVRAAERLRSMVAGDHRIRLLERYLSVAELHDLYANSDCYVSLHRSEGFGLTVAEAMARALPVIATDYSSTTEFFDETVGWPIPASMVDVGPGWYPYPEDAQWAEPDLAAAAEAMRQVADDPAEAARRGDAAREHILRTRTVDAAADWIRTELGTAYRTWRDRNADLVAGAPQAAATSGLARARAALHWRPETGSSFRFPLAPTLRKAVLRVIDHYDVHQRRVMGEIVDGTENVVNQLADDVDRAVTEQRKSLDTVHADLNRRIRRLTDRLDEVEGTLDRVVRRSEQD